MHKKKKLVTLSIIIGIFILGIFLIYFSASAYINSQINKELNDIKSRGEIISLSEFKKESVPEGENRALLYKTAIENLNKTLGITYPSQGKFVEYYKYYQENKEKIKSELGKNDKVFALMEETSMRNECNFEIDYENGMNAKLPDLLALRSIVQWMTIKAIDEMEEKNYDKALDYSSRCLLLARDMDNENFPVIHIVACAIIQIAIEPVNYMAENQIKANFEPVTAELELIHGSIKDNLLKSLEAERASGIDAFDKYLNLKGIDGKPAGPLESIKIIVAKPYYLADKLYYIRYISQGIDDIRKDNTVKAFEDSNYTISNIIAINLPNLIKINQETDKACSELLEKLEKIKNSQ